MKVISSIIAATLIVVACGQNQGSDTAGLPGDIGRLNPPKDSRFEDVMSIQAVEATLMNTVAAGEQTELQLGFQTSCANSLAPISFEQHNLANGKVEVHVSSYEIVTKQSLVAFCAQIYPALTQSIFINGKFAKEDVKLVFNQQLSPAQLPKDLVDAYTTDDVRVASVDALCPKNAKCILNGTRISLLVGTSGCVDTAALSYSFDEVNGKLELYVGALNLSSKDSEQVRCIRQNTQSFNISLISKYYAAEDINLHIQK